MDAVNALGENVVRRIKPERVDRLRRDLLAAGYYDVTPATVLGAQALLVGGAVLFSLLVTAASGAAIGTSIVLVAVAAGTALLAPRALLSNRARARLESIDREMPELVDLLVVAIEAGLGLFAALDHATARMTGPLRDELRLVLQEQGLGATTAETLGRLGERCDTKGVKSFCRTLIQGERLGASIGQSMRAIAVEMRKQRKADAEERAQKMPVKILIPLVFCIFPAMFVVILVPAMMEVFNGL